MNRTVGTAQWVSRGSSATRRSALGRPVAYAGARRGARLPSLPVDGRRRPSGWDRRVRRLDRVRDSVAICFGGVLGTAVATALCLALGA